MVADQAGRAGPDADAGGAGDERTDITSAEYIRLLLAWIKTAAVGFGCDMPGARRIDDTSDLAAGV